MTRHQPGSQAGSAVDGGGPLQALMMGELIRRSSSGLVGATFAYRLVSPMIGPQTMTVVAAPGGVAAGAEVLDMHGTTTAVSNVAPPPGA